MDLPSRVRRRVCQTWLVAAVALAGCELASPKVTGPTTSPSRPSTPTGSIPSLPEPNGGGMSDTGITLGDAAAPAAGADAGAPRDNNLVLVYAHSGSDLFKVNPQTLDITRVGPFYTADGRPLQNITDIAVDKSGRMLGITFTELLEIDANTAVSKVLAPLLADGQLNGLSWIRTNDGNEILAATSNDGLVLRIDPATGKAMPLGNLGGGLRSSGDIVSVASYGTLITLRGDGRGDGSDLLATIDPMTGNATVIGPTGFKQVWGVGFWGNRVFGFTQTGQFILIDPKTGAGKLIQQITAFPFWGAGVSTSVTVID
jgi:hypothetical protein